MKKVSPMTCCPTDKRRSDGVPEISSFRRNRPLSAFTLVELLVAMAVTLLLLGAVVGLFGFLGDTVTESKADLEMLLPDCRTPLCSTRVLIDWPPPWPT